MSEYKRPETLEEVEQHFEQIKPLMNPTMAYYESSRCLYCFDAPCIQACPTGIDIPLFIRQINTGNIDGAAKTIYDSNYFGNVCGKVCPTEVLCEGACVYNNQNVKPIEIGRLQSYATTDAVQKNKNLFEIGTSNGKKVAIIGAGPAGISCACELRSLGYEVDIFEAKAKPSGLALHGCAPYKVTNEEILAEMDYLQKQFGFTIHYNKPIRGQEDLEGLENSYTAIFLGIGLGATNQLSIDGIDAKGVLGATEFIEEVKLNPLQTSVGNIVVVIGGGNTAMDAASESARLGAEEVVLVYRRDKESMSAYEFEYDLAKAVGVKGVFNASPIQVLEKNGQVVGLRFIKTKVLDGKLETIPKSEFDIACDRVILATGQSKQVQFLQQIKGLELDKKGRIQVNSIFQTTNPKYFASGDALNGGAEVVNACGEAKQAAQGIHTFLS